MVPALILYFTSMIFTSKYIIPFCNLSTLDHDGIPVLGYMDLNGLRSKTKNSQIKKYEYTSINIHALNWSNLSGGTLFPQGSRKVCFPCDLIPSVTVKCDKTNTTWFYLRKYGILLPLETDNESVMHYPTVSG